VPQFLAGVELARAFYSEAVAPLLGDVPHAAARLGWGSDVLGLDDERSTDHGWGPRVQLFVEGDRIDEVETIVERGLPESFRGWPTRFGWDDVPVQHHVDVVELGAWLEERLGLDLRSGLETTDWLALPQQLLLEVTSGAVFHDPGGELAAFRKQLAWYPDDVWLWLLACQWRRVDQEEPFAGRAAEVGDELGSRIVAARQVRDFVRLCFLLERRYAPYSKWLGTAFSRLDAFAAVGPPLLRALDATAWREREDALIDAALAVARRHNATGVTRPVAEDVDLFHGRPFRVLRSARFVDACLERVVDQGLRSLPLVGGIDQWADSTDVLSRPAVARHARALYEAAQP
jgi:Domain of unknown function (DUF4037)